MLYQVREGQRGCLSCDVSQRRLISWQPAWKNPCHGAPAVREGAVYAAANRCRAVLKITPDGKVTTLMRATAPWSPTGVAVADGVIYVEEYEFPEAGRRQYEQRPRVRRLGRDGKVTMLAVAGGK